VHGNTATHDRSASGLLAGQGSAPLSLSAGRMAYGSAAALAHKMRQQDDGDEGDDEDDHVHLPGLPAHVPAREEGKQLFATGAPACGGPRGNTAGRAGESGRAASESARRSDRPSVSAVDASAPGARASQGIGGPMISREGAGSSLIGPAHPRPADLAEGGAERVKRALERMHLDAERQAPVTAPRIILALDTLDTSSADTSSAGGEDLGDFLRQLRADDGPSSSSGRAFPF
jgi:hypothetical protein